MALKASSIRIDLPEIPAVVPDAATQRELQIIYNAIHALQLAIDPAIAGTAYTVATLPTGALGDRAIVTDATAPTYLGTLTGGGAVKVPVFHNGTAWVAT